MKFLKMVKKDDMVNDDNRLHCPFCDNEELELKTTFKAVKEKYNYKDNSNTSYIDFYCNRCDDYYQLYITEYRYSTYVGWNKEVVPLGSR